MKVILTAALLLASVSANGNIEPVISIAIGEGGDKLSNSTGYQEYGSTAGTGFTVLGGILLPISPTVPHRFEMQFNAGFSVLHHSGGKKGDVLWSRFPLEAIYYYHNKKQNFRLGWGAIYHIENYISANGINSSAETQVDNALGFILAAERTVPESDVKDRPLIAAGFRFTNIKYKANSFSKDADGSSFQLIYTFTLKD